MSASLAVDAVALKRIRKASGLSLLDAARIAHVEPETVAAWEYGETAPSARQLGFLAKATGMPAEAFLGAQ